MNYYSHVENTSPYYFFSSLLARFSPPEFLLKLFPLACRFLSLPSPVPGGIIEESCSFLHLLSSASRQECKISFGILLLQTGEGYSICWVCSTVFNCYCHEEWLGLGVPARENGSTCTIFNAR